MVISKNKIAIKADNDSVAVALLSGGIDSPVAIHLMQSKINIIAVHFHQLPLTDEKEIIKVKELAKKLGLKRLYLVPFAEVLKLLVDKCFHNNFFILSKILMFQIAEVILKSEKKSYDNSFLITGENLAQVSSQTLSNMQTITSLVNTEILRPLLIFDKQEIISVAKSIGTYEVSKGPEVCGLLGPKSPKTSSEVKKINDQLKLLDFDSLLEKSLNRAEILNC